MNWHQTKPNRKTFRNPKPSSLEWHISNDEYCIFGNKKTRRTQPSQHNEMCISNSKYPSHERHSYRGCDLDRCIAHRLRIMMIKMMMMVAMIFPVIDYITFVFFSSRRFQLWSQNPLKNHANVRTVDRMSILKEKAQLTFYYYYFFFFRILDFFVPYAEANHRTHTHSLLFRSAKVCHQAHIFKTKFGTHREEDEERDILAEEANQWRHTNSSICWIAHMRCLFTSNHTWNRTHPKKCWWMNGKMAENVKINRSWFVPKWKLDKDKPHGNSK